MNMNIFQIITFLVVLLASFAYINKKTFNLPLTIGIMLLGTVFSLLILIANKISNNAFIEIKNIISTLDFSKIVLEILLSFLLFAGALHTNFEDLKENKASIILFSFFSVLISTFLIAGGLFVVILFFQINISFIYCLLFGALISPTDPIAVLGILTKLNVPKTAEINIVGESLFNDGVGVVIFVTLLTMINQGIENVTFIKVIELFFVEAIGGVLLGIALGYLLYMLLKSIDDYEVEVILTLAAVMGGNSIAQLLHVSAPLAMVVAGLFTGDKTKKKAMSDKTKVYVEKFWHLIDILMNTLLFGLIGLKISTIQYQNKFLIIALIIIPVIILARYISLFIPFSLGKKWINFEKKTIYLMTWGGLRGGLSIAMALSINGESEIKSLFVFLTYIIVMFSIFVQALTLKNIIKAVYK